MNLKLRLASQSPRRRELIKYLGYPYECIATNSDEIAFSSDPYVAACEISSEKANASLKFKPLDEGEVIIGADTTVVINGQTLGKPKDREDAKKMLSLLSGKEHSVFTGVTLLYLKNGYVVTNSFAAESKVFVDELSDSEIDAYLDLGEYSDKAGSYAIQGPFSKHIAKIEGDYANVVGFPVERIYQELKNISF